MRSMTEKKASKWTSLLCLFRFSRMRSNICTPGLRCITSHITSYITKTQSVSHFFALKHGLARAREQLATELPQLYESKSLFSAWVHCAHAAEPSLRIHAYTCPEASVCLHHRRQHRHPSATQVKSRDICDGILVQIIDALQKLHY